MCDVFKWDDCKEPGLAPFIVLYPQIGSNRITDDASRMDGSEAGQVSAPSSGQIKSK